MSVTSYLTIGRDVEVATEAKRSRFLCRLARVASEEAARAVVEEERRRHWAAGHHCSAFVLGPTGEVLRSSDDGEPSGTAGAPMLEVLRGHEVSDVVAVVSRWFGGVLLGAGGLVRAYSDAVRAGLEEAGVRERRLMHRYDVRVPHGDAGKLEHGLRAAGVVVRGVDYAGEATLHLAVPTAAMDRLPHLLADLSGGELTAVPVGSDWVDG